MIALLALTLALPAASGPDAFARSWPILLDRDEGAYRIDLDEDVYRHVLRTDLSDLVAFDSAGTAVPFGPVPLPPDASPTLVRSDVALPWFRVPRGSAARATETLELQFARGPDGRLEPLVRSTTTLEPVIEDVILDASAVQGGIDRLELALAPRSGDALDVRVDLFASDDLSSWRLVAPAQAVVSLEHEGRRLERRAIELPSLDAQYLLLSLSEGGGSLPLTGATAQVAEFAPGIPPLERRTISPSARPDPATGAFTYDTGGPFPVDRAQLALSEPNSVVSARLESRPGPDAPWTARSQTTAFRLRAGGEEIANLAEDIGPTRDREWRVVSTPPLAAAPRLMLGYRPDSYLLLAQGAPPYRLAAGSHVVRRDAYPLERLLSDVRSRLGAGWTPPVARLGPGSDSIGGVATPPPAPLPWQRWALWLVLAGGAAGIVLMVMRLLREREAGATEDGS